MEWARRMLGLPELASEHGEQVDQVLGLTHLLIAGLFLAWLLLFLWLIWRFRARRPVGPALGAEVHRVPGGKVPTAAEALVVVAEATLLLGFSLPLISALRDQPPDPQASVEVRVVAEQFAWHVHYPGPDGEFGRTLPQLIQAETNGLGLDREDPAAADDVVLLNQLHLPVGQSALLRLSARDVIHAFSIPEMRVKRDVVPGLEARLWFTPTLSSEDMARRKGEGEDAQPFRYEIVCMELCGLGHYRMRGFLTVHSAEGYAAWMEEQQRKLEEQAEVDDFWS